jgi:hypothetical protein
MSYFNHSTGLMKYHFERGDRFRRACRRLLGMSDPWQYIPPSNKSQEQLAQEATEWEAAHPSMTSAEAQAFIAANQRKLFVRNRVVPATPSGLGEMPYSEFLQTGYWKAVRKQVLFRDGHRCQKCNSWLQAPQLRVHHLTYVHHGDEANHMEDLVTLWLPVTAASMPREGIAGIHDRRAEAGAQAAKLLGVDVLAAPALSRSCIGTFPPSLTPPFSRL